MRYAKDGIGYAAATPTIYYLHSFAKTCVSPAVNTCLEVSVCGGELNRSISIIVVPSNGPPSNLDWSRPWHEILHEWNGKVQSVALEHGMKLWSHRSLTHCWKLAMHFASLPHDRWIQRILKWTPGGRYAAGCPRHNWVTKISAFMRFLQVDDWQRLAQDTPVWLHLTEEFVQFCRR